MMMMMTAQSVINALVTSRFWFLNKIVTDDDLRCFSVKKCSVVIVLGDDGKYSEYILSHS